MLGKQSKIIHLAIILAFLFVAGTIDLFHTDSIFGNDARCPACTFHSSAVAAAPFQLFQLPALVVVETVTLPASHASEEFLSLTEAARAPPLG